jgi:hypothetical protein
MCTTATHDEEAAVSGWARDETSSARSSSVRRGWGVYKSSALRDLHIGGGRDAYRGDGCERLVTRPMGISGSGLGSHQKPFHFRGRQKVGPWHPRAHFTDALGELLETVGGHCILIINVCAPSCAGTGNSRDGRCCGQLTHGAHFRP